MVIPIRSPIFRTIVRRKGFSMLSLLILALVYAGLRTLAFAIRSLRDVPRSNDDMIFY